MAATRRLRNVVSPGADVSAIKVRYEGVESVAVDEAGELVVTTYWGDVLRHRPAALQVRQGSNMSVSGRSGIVDENTVALEISSDYDPALELSVDAVPSFGTYLGGENGDVANDIAVDEAGAAYVTGSTRSVDFPTLDPVQGTYPGSWPAGWSSPARGRVRSASTSGCPKNTQTAGTAAPETGTI